MINHKDNFKDLNTVSDFIDTIDKKDDLNNYDKLMKIQIRIKNFESVSKKIKTCIEEL